MEAQKNLKSEIKNQKSNHKETSWSRKAEAARQAGLVYCSFLIFDF